MLNGNQVAEIEREWDSPRWEGFTRPYSAEDVARLRGTVKIEYTLARLGAERLWELMRERPFIRALGALTGNQAVPHVVKRINQALQRADQIDHSENRNGTYWFAPILADAEAGFGGALNVFELMKGMIEAGAAGVHFEDQLASEKKCGHMGGKVLLPTAQAVRNLISARLAADVMGVPTVIVARTDADGADLITSDVDPSDADFLTGERTMEGFYRTRAGLDQAIARGLAYAPYADVVWCETSKPDIEQARRFAEAIHEKFPGKLLAYNCSPSFNWKRNLSDEDIATFQEQLGEMGYKFQFITLAGFHTLNYAMFELAHEYKERGMAAYSELQQREFDAEEHGYTATKHQREVGAGYFDDVAQVVAGGMASTTALTGSTEESQFNDVDDPRFNNDSDDDP